MTTEIQDTIYSVFQTTAGNDLKKLIAGIPEPRTISYSQKNYSFIRRAIPGSVAVELPKYFKNILFFQELSAETCSELTGGFCAFCLDDTEEVVEVLELLKLVPKCKKYIVLIPRATTYCQELINRSNLDVTTLELPIEIVPLEENMFLVPSPRCFTRCFIQDDINDVYTIARSLLKLQMFTGGVERTFYAGDMAQRVFTLLQQMKDQCGSTYFKEPQFNDIFIIDRTVDLVTPLTSQFYYGGLLDDLYDYEYGYFKLPFDISLTDDPNTREVLFSDEDVYFKSMRGMNVDEARQYTQDQVGYINKLKDDLTESLGTVNYGPIYKKLEKIAKEKPIFELHQNLIIKIIKEKNFMFDIYNYEYYLLIQNPLDFTIIKQLINGGRVVEALRLLCFASLVSPDEINAKTVEDIQRRVIGYCGFEATTDLIQLEKSGLFDNDSRFFSKLSFKQKPKFHEIDETLHLLVNTKDTSVQDINKGYDGYVPILHRLVQHGLRGMWEKGTPIEKLLNKMKIPHAIDGKPLQLENTNIQRKVLVFVIGGVTQTEISLFAEMGKTLFKNRYDFHVGSTEIMTGNELIRSVCPCIASKSVKGRL